MFASVYHKEDPTIHYDRSDRFDLERDFRTCSCGSELTARMARHSREEHGQVICENCAILKMVEGTQLQLA